MRDASYLSISVDLLCFILIGSINIINIINITQQEISSSYIDSYLSLLASLFSSSINTSQQEINSIYIDSYLSLLASLFSSSII
jgi:hypothetical protein